MIPLVYHPGYNITAFGLEKLHPFDSRKYRRIYDALIARGLRKPKDFTRPQAVTHAELSKVHSQEYLRSICRPEMLSSILEVPIVRWLPSWLLDLRILRPMRRAAGGTILTGRLALKHGLAINLGGGYHHAAADRGGGFCVYADVPLAALILHKAGQVNRVLVIDLDVHQGDGIAAVIRSWSWASILDVYEEDIFPFPKQDEDIPLPVPAGLTGTEYLDVVRENLPGALDTLRPDLVIYNAGSDPFVGDPLARLRLTGADLVDRDLLVVSLARERDIPVAMVLSGGYSSESWRLHADAIEGILTRFDRSQSNHP